MPSIHLTENISYDFTWEDLQRDNPSLDAVLGPERKQRYLSAAKSNRRIAGNKRVAQHQEKQEYQGRGEVFQSITAAKGLRHSSFEELRLECYLQSTVAKGSPPTAVDPALTPWAVIPPVFNASKQNVEDEEMDYNDVDMED